MWYPQEKDELEREVRRFLSCGEGRKGVHGIIVPHAGYVFSGAVAGQAYSMISGIAKKAVVLSPSHYIPLAGVLSHNKDFWETPLGKLSVNDFGFRTQKIDLKREHAIDNQIPFLQEAGVKEILPLMVGEIDLDEAEDFAKRLSKIYSEEKELVFVFSTDLSHFLSYDSAVEKDLRTIRAIENLDLKGLKENCACGFFPLLIFFSLARMRRWRAKLIDYKNSGDVTEDKSRVVGYGAFWF
ncbi:AmmeMemoRadiSam system protein B [Candidatus Pacearchaeota archaeon]|nr:MAG: AmmeMemoRadiSam system protein B [Candidatus Pacearchaeota archaeon]